jgi:hypothetical protein
MRFRLRFNFGATSRRGNPAILAGGHAG